MTATIYNIDDTFQPFSKIARLSRECVITEKIDGTNAQVLIVPHDGHETPTGAINIVSGCAIYAGSRSRWLQLGKATDNFGFAAWVNQNAAELVKLGPGRHYGEWWGLGIQRGYGLHERRFSLFNVGRWVQQPDISEPLKLSEGYDYAPKCCHVVPVLSRCNFDSSIIDSVMKRLAIFGSNAAPGFANPEGIIVYHTAAKMMFKQTTEDDAVPKSSTKQVAA